MKRNIIILIFIINLLTTSIYITLHLLHIEVIEKLDFTLLIIYDVVSLVLFAELLHEKDNNKKNRRNY
jgi:hypothetical protein